MLLLLLLPYPSSIAVCLRKPSWGSRHSGGGASSESRSSVYLSPPNGAGASTGMTPAPWLMTAAPRALACATFFFPASLPRAFRSSTPSSLAAAAVVLRARFIELQPKLPRRRCGDVQKPPRAANGSSSSVGKSATVMTSNFAEQSLSEDIYFLTFITEASVVF